MVHSVEIGGVDLSDRASEAAFALSSLISQPDQWLAHPSWAPEHSQLDEDRIDAMDWDEPWEPLFAELAFIWQRVMQSERKLDLKNILDVIPRFEKLPQQARANNFRSDGKQEINKVQKVRLTPCYICCASKLGSMLE